MLADQAVIDSEGLTLEHSQGDVAKWQRYSVESFVFATLLNAARCSIRTGCAIVFT